MTKLSPSAWSSLRDLARGLGFHDLRATPARALAQARSEVFPDEPASTGLQEWLAAGQHGDMDWMAATAAQRQDPTIWWPGARTVLAGLVPHDEDGEPGDALPEDHAQGARGLVSRHAWGRDYHVVVKRLLMALGRRLEKEVPGARWRTCIDRGAAMEKPNAVLAGLGWIGKHGNLLRTDGSSWFFIGLLLTDVEVDADAPFTADHCGTCTACIDACPTGAIVAPQQVDARRCISYLTIETDSVPEPLREGVGRWVHGCDACQDACPWNRHRLRRGHGGLGVGPISRGPLLRDLLRLDDGAYAALTPKSALKRERRAGLVRNAALAAGNSGDRDLVPELADLLRDEDVSVRSHAAWALGRLGGSAAREALERTLRSDPDPRVRDEAEGSLARLP